MTRTFTRSTVFVLQLLGVALSIAPLRAQDTSRAEVGTFRSDSTVLRYALDRPSGPGPFPIIVFVHGSGRVTHDEMLNIVPRFNALGFAVFRYDKRGVGESGGTYRGVNATTSMTVIPQLAGDAAAAFATACAAPHIDSKRCGFFGASQAGWIIPEAMRIVKRAAFAILFSGATIPVGNQMYYNKLTVEDKTSLDSASAALAHFDGNSGYDPRQTLASMFTPSLWLLGLQDKLLPNRMAIAQLDSLRLAGRPIHVKGYQDYGHNLGPEIWSEVEAFLAPFRSH